MKFVNLLVASIAFSSLSMTAGKYFSMQRVLAESKTGAVFNQNVNKLRDDLQKKAHSFERTLESYGAELLEKYKDLSGDDQSGTQEQPRVEFSEQDKMLYAQEQQRLMIEFRKADQQAQENMQRLGMMIDGKVRESAKEFAESNGFEKFDILDNIYYVAPSKDVTDDFIMFLNKKHDKEEEVKRVNLEAQSLKNSLLKQQESEEIELDSEQGAF